MLLPISHRGLWWPNLTKQNTPEALNLALSIGYGVEFDLRRGADGKLYLRHDADLAALPIDKLLEIEAEPWLASLPPDGPPLLVDLKEAGTEEQIVEMLAAHDLLARSFLFDFELCGADPALARATHSGAQCLERVSDRQEPPSDGLAVGVWLDQWDSDWVNAGDVAIWKMRGPVFIVGPDLQGRAFDLAKLSEWRDADGICTDIPHLLWPILSGEAHVHPQDPWW